MFAHWFRQSAEGKSADCRRRGMASRKLSLEVLENRLVPATHIWTGQVSDRWSDQGNWTGGTPAGDPSAVLQFPASAANHVNNNNDLPGLTVDSIVFSQGNGYVLGGLPIILQNAAGGINDVAVFTNTINFDITLQGSFAGSPVYSVGVYAGGTLILRGRITDTSLGAGIAKNGEGILEVAHGGNSYRGDTQVNFGTLRAGADHVLPGNTALLVAAGATYDNNNYQNDVGSLEGMGQVLTSGGPLVVGHNDRSTTFGGVISGSGEFLKEGTGILTLTGANTVAQLGVDAGTLQVGARNAISSTTVVVVDQDNLHRGNLDLNNFSITIENLDGLGTVALGSGTLTLAGVDPAPIGFDGVISGSGGLTKMGAGRYYLSGNNTYTGTTRVAAGTLLVYGSQPQSAVTVDAGATLGGSGTVGIITTQGTVSPGYVYYPGRLTSAGAVFNGGSTFQVRLNGTMPGQTYDQLAPTFGVNLGANTTLSITIGFATAFNDSFTILPTSGPIYGTFNGLPEGALFVPQGRPFRIHYVQGTGVVLTHVPLVVRVDADDGGPETFRESVFAALASTEYTPIQFNIGSGHQTINLTSPLPVLTRPVVIDGTTQPGYAGTPLIELNGAGAGAGADGLRLGPAGAMIVPCDFGTAHQAKDGKALSATELLLRNRIWSGIDAKRRTLRRMDNGVPPSGTWIG